eukprot:UN14418
MNKIVNLKLLLKPFILQMLDIYVYVAHYGGCGIDKFNIIVDR